MANNTSPHILNTSANLLGFCLFIITSLHIASPLEHILQAVPADDLVVRAVGVYRPVTFLLETVEEHPATPKSLFVLVAVGVEYLVLIVLEVHLFAIIAKGQGNWCQVRVILQHMGWNGLAGGQCFLHQALVLIAIGAVCAWFALILINNIWRFV